MPPRPHRVIINVDADTREALRALAYASGLSLSAVAAETLRMLLPTIRPVMEAIGELRTAPGQAMEKLSAHAQDLADLAQATVEEIRASSALRPPSCNTGVNLPTKRPE
jgi:hypothetical protein